MLNTFVFNLASLKTFYTFFFLLWKPRDCFWEDGKHLQKKGTVKYPFLTIFSHVTFYNLLLGNPRQHMGSGLSHYKIKNHRNNTVMSFYNYYAFIFLIFSMLSIKSQGIISINFSNQIFDSCVETISYTNNDIFVSRKIMHLFWKDIGRL